MTLLVQRLCQGPGRVRLAVHYQDQGHGMFL
jgi:hypothetical protein